ncbi:MAG: hypothetical protein IJ733_05210, partial [Lachnospiraceae bacterium]|nr:hypothetical protein [Lachnospiraceae bacterium]
MKQDEVRESFFKRMFAKGEREESRKVLTFVLCMALVLAECLMSLGIGGEKRENQAEAADDTVTIKGYSARGDGKWDLIEFGHYVQKADAGATPEPIQWRVLLANATEAVLLSDKILDYRKMADSDTEAASALGQDWSGLGIWRWLNSAESGFLANALDEEERKAVVEPASYSLVVGDTKSPVFLLDSGGSFQATYGLDYDTPAHKIAKNTEYAAKQAVDLSAVESGGWMLRDQALSSDVNNAGRYISADGELKTMALTAVAGVRPCLHIDLTKEDVWKYAGTVDSAGNIVTPTPTSTPTATPTGTPTVS